MRNRLPLASVLAGAAGQRGTAHAISSIDTLMQAARPQKIARQPSTGISHCTGSVDATMPKDPDISIHELARN